MQRSGWSKPLKNGLYGIAALVLAAIVLGGWFLRSPPDRVPAFSEVRERYCKSDVQLLDRNGSVIHELRVDFTGRRLEWMSLSEISPRLLAAVVASEDKRFYRHSGVDLVSLVHASLESVAGRGRGASTITMQLASFVNSALRPETVRRSWLQKWQQIGYARAMEKKWSKDQILEAYLNLITFRGELRGITAASRGLFDKDPIGLNTTESLVLASLIRSPNAPLRAVAQRAAMLASAMNTGAIPGTVETAVEEALGKRYAVRQRVASAPHPAHLLLNTGGKDVRCSLDGPLQRFAQDLLAGQLAAVKEQNVRDGAILVVDNKSGEILAYVGNSGSNSSARYIDGVRARRQPGSTLKPFLYALAMDNRIITPASLISDTPLDIPTERGIYRPENYDRQFKGLVPVRVALASSLNIPAVKVLMLAGPDRFVEKLKELGFSDLKDADHYGYSLALGALDVSLLEMVNAYRTLANGGIHGELTLLPGGNGEAGRKLFSHEAAFIVANILSDREARSTTFGFENSLATPFWSAAKTGTSKDMRDNWCLGFSDRFTVGVWVGNFSGSSMWDVSGVTGAAPIWHEIMSYLHGHVKSAAPHAPAGVSARTFGTDEGLTTRREWFIKGTEPASVEVRITDGSAARIVYPPPEVIFAMDPDIPPDNQKIFFEASGNNKDLRWLLNGQETGKGPLYGWTPEAGKFTLTLSDRNNSPLDQVMFTVRE
jgi:penicillin-binding protein 1C